MKSERDLAARLAETLFDYRTGTAQLQGFSIESIAATYGTPLFVYDAGVLVRQYQRLRRALPPAIDIYYSVKANSSSESSASSWDRGAGCEIASGGRICAGPPRRQRAERMVFAGRAEAGRNWVCRFAGIGEITSRLRGNGDVAIAGARASHDGGRVDPGQSALPLAAA